MEFEIVRILNQFGGNFTSLVTNLVSSRIFLFVLWFIIALIIYIRDKERYLNIILALIIAAAIDLILTEGLLKHILLPVFSLVRTRPYLAYPKDITPVGEVFSDSSFPSGHMAIILAGISVLFYYYKKCWPFMLFVILLMAFARIHNGMHYPSDVCAGIILGIGYGVAAIYIVNKYKK